MNSTNNPSDKKDLKNKLNKSLRDKLLKKNVDSFSDTIDPRLIDSSLITSGDSAAQRAKNFSEELEQSTQTLFDNLRKNKEKTIAQLSEDPPRASDDFINLVDFNNIYKTLNNYLNTLEHYTMSEQKKSTLKAPSKPIRSDRADTDSNEQLTNTRKDSFLKAPRAYEAQQESTDDASSTDVKRKDTFLKAPRAYTASTSLKPTEKNTEPSFEELNNQLNPENIHHQQIIEAIRANDYTWILQNLKLHLINKIDPKKQDMVLTLSLMQPKCLAALLSSGFIIPKNSQESLAIKMAIKTKSYQALEIFYKNGAILEQNVLDEMQIGLQLNSDVKLNPKVFEDQLVNDFTDFLNQVEEEQNVNLLGSLDENQISQDEEEFSLFSFGNQDEKEQEKPKKEIIDKKIELNIDLISSAPTIEQPTNDDETFFSQLHGESFFNKPATLPSIKEEKEETTNFTPIHEEQGNSFSTAENQEATTPSTQIPEAQINSLSTSESQSSQDNSLQPLSEKSFLENEDNNADVIESIIVNPEETSLSTNFLTPNPVVGHQDKPFEQLPPNTFDQSTNKIQQIQAPTHDLIGDETLISEQLNVDSVAADTVNLSESQEQLDDKKEIDRLSLLKKANMSLSAKLNNQQPLADKAKDKMIAKLLSEKSELESKIMNLEMLVETAEEISANNELLLEQNNELFNTIEQLESEIQLLKTKQSPPAINPIQEQEYQRLLQAEKNLMHMLQEQESVNRQQSESIQTLLQDFHEIKINPPNIQRKSTHQEHFNQFCKKNPLIYLIDDFSFEKISKFEQNTLLGQEDFYFSFFYSIRMHHNDAMLYFFKKYSLCITAYELEAFIQAIQYKNYDALQWLLTHNINLIQYDYCIFKLIHELRDIKALKVILQHHDIFDERLLIIKDSVYAQAYECTKLYIQSANSIYLLDKIKLLLNDQLNSNLPEFNGLISLINEKIEFINYIQDFNKDIFL